LCAPLRVGIIETTTMHDDKTKRGSTDRARINVQEPYEVRWWAQRWNVTEEQLKDAAKRVGSNAKDIAACLGKPWP
jgi:hypothetical protein